ncbi:MAG TPA: MoaD/ThiS family protein [Gemmatimonadales bacterium]|nr:MoaD/ThiS family protein [Gemmatimonadales bacterium]
MSPTAPSTISVRVLLFAAYAEAAGRDEETLAVDEPATAESVVQAFRARYPEADLVPPRPLVAINQVHATLKSPVRPGDEVALLPPMAGG